MFGYVNVQGLSVRAGRAAAHVGNYAQLISRGLHPLVMGYLFSYTCVIFVQIYVQTIYDMLRYPKL